MGFKARRGRPSLNLPKKDLGTEELRKKKMAGITGESLDLCQEYNLISTDQHWAGIHFRWLYTVRFGAFVIRRPELIEETGGGIVTREEEWREKREGEYKQAIDLLAKYKAKEVVMDICIFNKSPKFLNHYRQWRQTMENKTNIGNFYSEELSLFQDGLGELVSLWYPRTTKKRLSG